MSCSDRDSLWTPQDTFLILPDDIGHGSSSKPSDGLHAHFPQYDYDDMVRSQHAMLVDGLKIDHLRLILGTSMGCMQTFVWGETYPGFADALAPFACLPTAVAGRNRMTRYMAIQAVKQDPQWLDGEYRSQPVQGLRTANEILFIMGSSPLQLQKRAPNRAAAEAYIDEYLKRVMAATDANDLIYYLNASRNYDQSANLERITVPVLYITSGDDFVNPPELGIAEPWPSECRDVDSFSSPPAMRLAVTARTPSPRYGRMTCSSCCSSRSTTSANRSL
jgi:homoserine O-acetyltransferase/O-succinyltransferase